MNRKQFLSLFPTLAPLLSFSRLSGNHSDRKVVVPRYLKPGDRIGISCPAGYITEEEIQPAVTMLTQWGLKVVKGDTVGKRDFGFGGTDVERRIDFQRMLDDPSIHAIMCARGGYGMIRIIDELDFTCFVSEPKWILGFSDITILHSHLNRNYGIASVHSKMCNSFPEKWNEAEPEQKQTILSIRDVLTGTKMVYNVKPNAMNRNGVAAGELIGGNLKTIESLSGTRSEIRTDGKILFLEDTGEYLYSIDRMFWNLKRTKKLERLAGLIIGGFKVKPDDPGEEFGRSVQQIVLEKTKSYHYPVCFDFPVGHQKENYALKHSVRHRLTVANDRVRLESLA
jgi:muramoyltetrapeptide carboxypeptidase